MTNRGDKDRLSLRDPLAFHPGAAPSHQCITVTATQLPVESQSHCRSGPYRFNASMRAGTCLCHGVPA